MSLWNTNLRSLTDNINTFLQDWHVDPFVDICILAKLKYVPIGEVPAYRTALEITARRKAKEMVFWQQVSCQDSTQVLSSLLDCISICWVLLITDIIVIIIISVSIISIGSISGARMLFLTPRSLPCVSLTPRNAWPTWSHYQLCLFSGCAFCCCFSLR